MYSRSRWSGIEIHNYAIVSVTFLLIIEIKKIFLQMHGEDVRQIGLDDVEKLYFTKL